MGGTPSILVKKSKKCYNYIMEKKYLTFYLNGEKKNFKVSELKGFTLLDFLRENLKLTGTKKGCSEGDCGACTVVIGSYSPLFKRVLYKTVTSCIYPVFKIDGKHVITIEGLDENGELHPIQKSFIEHHAVQCGFCTPGMIMSFFGLLLNNKKPTEGEILKALSGNLCRCTGYKAIKESCVELGGRDFKKPKFVLDVENKLEGFSGDTYFSNLPPFFPFEKYFIPESTKTLFEILKNYRSFKILNGSSDFFVNLNRNLSSPEVLIDISEIKELKYIEKNGDYLKLGGNVTFRELIDFLRGESILGEFIDVIEVIGSNQIRNMGTPAGNIGNSSPIADFSLLLLSLDALLTLKSNEGNREVYLKDFYRGYKDTLLKENEIISEIKFKIPEGRISFLKTSKRKEVDIASVNSSLLINLNGDVVGDLKISFGGVYPYPVRIFKGEDFLKGKKVTFENVLKLAEICKDEVKPISDVRGSAEFRKKLVYNHILKHFSNIYSESLEMDNGK